MAIGLIAGCSPAPDPSKIIAFGDPAPFTHSIGVFTLNVPSGWRAVQDSAETEAYASFTDPNGWASLIAYTGLLDRRLSDEEGLNAVDSLARNLLGSPQGYQVVGRQRLPDGAFEVTVSFLSDSYRRRGRAVFYDKDLALAGTIVVGTEADWNTIQSKLTPFADSFRFDPAVVQGTYFEPLVGDYYGLAVPAGWPQQNSGEGTEISSRSRMMFIRLIEKDAGRTLSGAEELIDESIRALRTMGLNVQPISDQTLPGGRLKVTLGQGQRSVIGYVEQFDTTLVGLFFEMPADRVSDYQPFMDFIYYTYVTGPP